MRAPSTCGRAPSLMPRGKGSAVPDKTVLIMRLHRVGGEDVAVERGDLSGENEALGAVAHAIDEHRSLILDEARYEREHEGPQPGQRGAVAGVENGRRLDRTVPLTAWSNGRRTKRILEAR